MKIIGLRYASFTSEQVEKLTSIANRYGYKVLVIPMEDTSPNLTDCELLMGVFTPEMLRGAKSLIWLHSFMAGVELLIADDLYQNPDKLMLTSSTGAYGIAISEYMLCGLMMIQRRMPMYIDNQRQHLWKQYPGITTVFGSNIAVVGIGDLGGNFARRCHDLGAKVTGVRRSAKSDKPEYLDKVYDIGLLDEAISDADVVALCLPSTKDTIGLFDATRIGKLKKGAIVLNVGRGSALDEAALAKALQAGELGGALLDVTNPEPMLPDNPLWDCPNTIITPHVSGIDRDRLSAGIVYEIYRENLERFFTGKPLRNLIDRKRGY